VDNGNIHCGTYDIAQRVVDSCEKLPAAGQCTHEKISVRDLSVTQHTLLTWQQAKTIQNTQPVSPSNAARSVITCSARMGNGHLLCKLTTRSKQLPRTHHESQKHNHTADACWLHHQPQLPTWANHEHRAGAAEVHQGFNWMACKGASP
jgi:hypothetical protein